MNFKNILTQKKGAPGAKGAGGNQAPPIKLPRTGIEQPFLRDRPRFKEFCSNFEPIHQFNTAMCDEYARLDAEKLLSN